MRESFGVKRAAAKKLDSGASKAHMLGGHSLDRAEYADRFDCFGGNFLIPYDEGASVFSHPSVPP